MLCDSTYVMIMHKKEKVENRLTIPPKANIALYWSKVWLKMQKKGITPATKNLAKGVEEDVEDLRFMQGRKLNHH